MNIGRIDGSQSFSGLNFNNVSTNDRIFIKTNFRKLKELGQKYDIMLISAYSDKPEFSAIDIYVKPLKENLNFWERLFPPRGTTTFEAKKTNLFEPLQKNILDSINDALNNLTHVLSEKSN